MSALSTGVKGLALYPVDWFFAHYNIGKGLTLSHNKMKRKCGIYLILVKSLLGLSIAGLFSVVGIVFHFQK